MKAKTEPLVAPWAGLLTLVGPRQDPAADRVFVAFSALLFGDGSRSRSWSETVAEIPATRDSVIRFGDAVHAYEQEAAAGHFISFRSAKKLNLPMITRGLVRTGRAPTAYLSLLRKHSWCNHPNVVYSERTMAQFAGKVRGLLGPLGEGEDVETQTDELANIPRVG